MMAADKRGFLRTEHEPEDWGAPARDKQREETQEGGALLGRMEGLPVTLTRHRSSQGREPCAGPRGGPRAGGRSGGGPGRPSRICKDKDGSGQEGGEGVTRGAESGVRDEGAVDTPHRDPWKSRT